jgi:hypothetical protein
MNAAPMRVARTACLAVTVSLGLLPLQVDAQSWLPAEGSLSFGIDYTDTLHKKHYTATGKEVDAGHTDSQTLSLSANYSPRDRLAFTATLPVVRTRYRGEAGHGGHHLEIDDGRWHTTVTDLLLTASYQATDGVVAVAPYLGVVIPTHDYETLGHSAPGRGLEELWLGAYAGTSLHEWLSNTYIQLRGNYAFVEKVQGISHDRINAMFEIGYFVNPSVSVRALVSSQWTKGGIDVPVPVTDPLFPYHDQLAAEEFVNVGGGCTWVLNDRMSLYGIYVQAIEGENGHKVDHRVTLGFTFSPGGS